MRLTLVPDEFFIDDLPNGVTLLGQKMPNVSSAAMTLLVPAGASHDAPGAEGAASVAAEWCLRGAGDRDTHQLNDALDALGCRHGEYVQSEHILFSSAQLGRNLADVLGIYADIVRRPRLEKPTFEPCRNLVCQDLVSLEDQPAQKCNVLLREKFYPYPLGRCAYGRQESLGSMTDEDVRRHVRTLLGPRGAIMAIAGNIDWESFRRLAKALFLDWQAAGGEPVAIRKPEGGAAHVAKDSAQVHIAMAHRSVPFGHHRYYAARIAESVLSGGMSSRLFTEVREKRGLVYHVSSHYNSLKGLAGMFTYAGTRPEVAQETFNVVVRELRRLSEGIEPDELTRSRTQLKSSLIMQGQSTTARAGALAADWYHLHRLRSLAEMSEAIDRVTGQDVLAYLREFPAEDFTTLVIGPEAIDTAAAGK
jgi:predicted Zn-dependent peptidase